MSARADLVRLIEGERERLIAFLQGFVRVDTSKFADHHYPVFEVQVPELAPFMRAGIRRQYGEEPPI